MVRQQFIDKVVKKYVAEAEQCIQEKKSIRNSMLIKALENELGITNMLVKLKLILTTQFKLDEEEAKELLTLFGSNLIIFSEAARLDEQDLLKKQKEADKWQVAPEISKQDKAKEIKKKQKINKQEFINVVKLMSDKYAIKSEKKVLDKILNRISKK
ncbi:MAG: hypothetical protein KAT66_00435 [Candidatus Lokiarchaeota archaeon]|nr:hypothetical protein [Candidatus Lokiarchaeota archaeon]